MWYSEQIGLDCDILVFGKKSQVCGVALADSYDQILDEPLQLLDVTFDGDLIDMIRATYVLKAIRQNSLLAHVLKVSEGFRRVLADRVENFRSAGCLIAFDLPDRDTRDAFVRRCFEHGVLVNKAGDRSIRLRPHLAFDLDVIQEFVVTVDQVGLF